jgi:hypothetical protein
MACSSPSWQIPGSWSCLSALMAAFSSSWRDTRSGSCFSARLAGFSLAKRNSGGDRGFRAGTASRSRGRKRRSNCCSGRLGADDDGPGDGRLAGRNFRCGTSVLISGDRQLSKLNCLKASLRGSNRELNRRLNRQISHLEVYRRGKRAERRWQGQKRGSNEARGPDRSQQGSGSGIWIDSRANGAQGRDHGDPDQTTDQQDQRRFGSVHEAVHETEQDGDPKRDPRWMLGTEDQRDLAEPADGDPRRDPRRGNPSGIAATRRGERLRQHFNSPRWVWVPNSPSLAKPELSDAPLRLIHHKVRVGSPRAHLWVKMHQDQSAFGWIRRPI